MVEGITSTEDTVSFSLPLFSSVYFLCYQIDLEEQKHDSKSEQKRLQPFLLEPLARVNGFK